MTELLGITTTKKPSSGSVCIAGLLFDPRSYQHFEDECCRSGEPCERRRSTQEASSVQLYTKYRLPGRYWERRQRRVLNIEEAAAAFGVRQFRSLFSMSC